MPGPVGPGQGAPNLGGGPPGMPPQQYGQPPAMRQPAGPPQFGGPPQRPPMTPNSAVAGPPGFGEGQLLRCKFPPGICVRIGTPAGIFDRGKWGNLPEAQRPLVALACVLAPGLMMREASVDVAARRPCERPCSASVWW